MLWSGVLYFVETSNSYVTLDSKGHVSLNKGCMGYKGFNACAVLDKT